MPAHSPVV